MTIRLTLEFVEADAHWREFARCITGGDRDVIREAEWALNEAVEKMTGVDPEIEIEMGPGLAYLPEQERATRKVRR